MNVEEEGVIKFTAKHTQQRLPDTLPEDEWAALRAWRVVLWDLQLIGQVKHRYGGAGFGNVSLRVPHGAMLITGTQTSGPRDLGVSGWCVVNDWDVARNEVHSVGTVLPSSESLTHATLYDLKPTIRAVVHVHTPLLWRHAEALGIPTTRREVPYGTPAMAKEMARLWDLGTLPRVGILSMAGHEDGVISLGESVAVAASRMVQWHARAVEHEQRIGGTP